MSTENGGDATVLSRSQIIDKLKAAAWVRREWVFSPSRAYWDKVWCTDIIGPEGDPVREEIQKILESQLALYIPSKHRDSGVSEFFFVNPQPNGYADTENHYGYGAWLWTPKEEAQ